MNDYWPQETFEAALEVFGPTVYADGSQGKQSRTYIALHRRILHALAVWQRKFGPLNAEQEQYADAVLASVIRKARTESAGDRRKLWPYAQAGLGRAIFNERVEAGMKRRAGYVDVSAQLEGVLT